MALKVVRLQVADYEVWKSVFDEVEEVRREYGWEKHELFQEASNPNTAVVIGHLESLDRAKQYLADERVRAALARSVYRDRLKGGFSTKWKRRTIEALASAILSET